MNSLEAVDTDHPRPTKPFRLTSIYRGGENELPANLLIPTLNSIYNCDKQMRLMNAIGKHPAIIVDHEGGFRLPYHFELEDHYHSLKLFPSKYTERFEKEYVRLMVKEFVESLLFWQEAVREHFKVNYELGSYLCNCTYGKNTIMVSITCRASHKAVLDEIKRSYTRINSFLGSDDEVRGITTSYVEDVQFLIHGKASSYATVFLVTLDQILPNQRLIDLSDFDKRYDAQYQTNLYKEYLK